MPAENRVRCSNSAAGVRDARLESIFALKCPQFEPAGREGMASTSLSRVARLENWFWTPSPPARDALSGVIFDDPPPRSWPDGTVAQIFNVSELEQRGAAEGKIIMTVSGRRYLLGKAATHASLAAECDAAQREAEALREQLEELQSAARPALTHLGRKKRPRGRAPAGCGWDEQRGGWFDENGKLFELVDHPQRKKKAAEKRAAAMAARGAAAAEQVSSGVHVCAYACACACTCACVCACMCNLSPTSRRQLHALSHALTQAQRPPGDVAGAPAAAAQQVRPGALKPARRALYPCRWHPSPQP